MSTNLVSAGAGPFVPGAANVQMNPVWHRRSFAIGAMGPEVVFFGEAAGVGTVGPQHTNMTRAFELEAPREATVMAMRINFYDTDDADIYGIVKAYTVQLLVGGNALLNAPPDWWSAGHGIETAAGFNNGSPTHQAIFGLKPYPIRIPSGVGFSVRFIGSAGYTLIAAGTIGVFLDGPFSKPVS